MSEPKASLSKVSPNPKKQQLLRQGQFALLVLICLVIGVCMALPKSKKVPAMEATPTSTQDLTLSQNLELIERMKLEERNKLLMTNQQPLPERTTPPVLRRKSQEANSLSKEMQLRMNAPTSFDIEASAGGTNNTPVNTTAGSRTLSGRDENSQFVNNQEDITSVFAKQLPHPEWTIPAGELIAATLETAINSNLPGMVRALTTQDSYSLKNNHLLIPRGSTLVGQFNASLVEGQSRLLVVWNRIQLPDGIIVTLNSPGTDTLGRSGQEADFIDRHFFARFGASALLSVLGAYTATGGVSGQDQYNSASQYRTAIANSFQQSSSQALEKNLSIASTLQINQGTRIHVFVAHDLDFAAVNKGGSVWK